MAAGKPQDQAVAIAYSERRRTGGAPQKKKAKMHHYIKALMGEGHS